MPTLTDTDKQHLHDLERLMQPGSGFRLFLQHYVRIRDATTNAAIPWEWWPVHEQMCHDADTERQLVALKARQIGWSWFWAARTVYDSMFSDYFMTLIFSQGQRESDEFLDRCKFIRQHLPGWLQPALSAENQSEMEFAVTGSKVLSLPSTEHAGRSFTASRVVVDEAAFHQYAETNYAAYKPSIDAGGQIVFISTANGAGGFFHQLYTDAKAGVNGFAARFYPWSVRPGRDAAWYEERRREYARFPGKLEQEYPNNDIEAFRMSGNLRFDRQALQAHRVRAEAQPPLPAAVVIAAGLPHLLHPLVQSGALTVWLLPRPGQPYALGSDVAEGLDGRDFSCTNVLLARTLQHAAALHGHWEPSRFGMLSEALARWYNTALWGIERNNHGHTVLHIVDQLLHYPRLYWHEDPVVQSDRQRMQEYRPPPKKLGWPTTQSTKPGLIDDLAEAIVTFALASWDMAFWDECQTYIVNARGGTEAGPGSHDDRVMAMAIARRMAMQPGAQTVSQRSPYRAYEPEPIMTW